MIGKKIKVNDFKFKYGQETIFINVYGAFKYKKNNNKYIVYSYDNSKLYYGSLFVRNNELVIMLSKNDSEDLVDKFIDNILDNNDNNKDFDIISLDKIDSVQVIDEGIINKKVDINKLSELTIPINKIQEETNIKPQRRKISIYGIFFILFIIVVIVFFFLNPEIIVGRDKNYICNIEYSHKVLSIPVIEEVKITFNEKNKVKSSAITKDYVFNDAKKYNKFKNNGEFYRYMNEGDTYKFIDENKTYRVMSNVENLSEYFSSDDENSILEYYKEKNYKCKKVEVE